MMKELAKQGIGPARPDLTDDDIYEAMKKIPGYLGITPGDFKEVYVLACEHALIVNKMSKQRRYPKFWL